MKRTVFITLLFSSFCFLFGTEGFVSGEENLSLSVGPSESGTPSPGLSKCPGEFYVNEPTQIVLSSSVKRSTGLDQSIFMDILYSKVKKLVNRLAFLKCEHCNHIFNERYHDNYFTYAARLYCEMMDGRCGKILEEMLRYPIMFEFADINHRNNNGCNAMLYIIAVGDIGLFEELLRHVRPIDLDFGHAHPDEEVRASDLYSLNQIKALSCENNGYGDALYDAIRLRMVKKENGGYFITKKGAYFISRILQDGGTIPPCIQDLYDRYNKKNALFIGIPTT